MKNLPFWFLGLATLFALGGMGFGIYMAASEDHTLASAHAHNNLIGWVSMALYGLYYKVVPAAALSRLASLHFILSLFGALLFPFGIGLVIMGQTAVLVGVASMLVIASMALFAYIVFSNKSGLHAG